MIIGWLHKEQYENLITNTDSQGLRFSICETRLYDLHIERSQNVHLFKQYKVA